MYEFKNWYPWDVGTGTAAIQATFEPSDAPHTFSNINFGDSSASNRDAARVQFINVKQVSQLMIRGFGTDTDNDAAQMQITGWMENGPGQILLTMDCTLGSLQYTEAIIGSASDVPNDFTVVNMFEVDTYALTTNNCRAYVETAGANLTGFVVMNTMQCRYLELEVDIDGTSGATAVSMGLIWRPLS